MRNPAKQSVLTLVESAQNEYRLCTAETRAQAHQLARGAACGLLVRPHPGMYASPQFWDDLSPEERNLYIARALAQKQPAWVFAGPTAALAYGLSVSWSCLTEVCMATSRYSHTSRRGSIRRIIVSNDDVVERAGLRVTSFIRTVYDCLRTMSFCDALVVADSALRRANLSRERLKANMLRRFGSMTGIQRVCSIIDLADGRSENGGESYARGKMISLGYAIPDLQRTLPDLIEGGEGYRADYAWDLPDGTIVYGELDGHDKYFDINMTGGKTTEDILLDERRREARLTLTDKSVRVMRFSLAEARNTSFFDHLLSAYGIPRNVFIPEVAKGEQ